MIPDPERETGEIAVKLSTSQIIAAVQAMDREEQESFVEDLLAAVSPEYLDSIREARADYDAGRFCSHDEAFG
jgi:predicted transcriptional regulator